MQIVVIVILLTINIVINFYFLKEKFVNKIIDKIISIIGIISSTIIVFSLLDKINMLDIGHFLYCGVYIPIGSFFSKNEYVILVNIINILIIITTRYYNKCCILTKKQNNKGKLLTISKNMGLNWWYLYPLFLFISLAKYIWIKYSTICTDNIVTGDL